MPASENHGSDLNRCRQCPTRRVCIAAAANEDQLNRLPQHLRCIETVPSGHHLFYAGDSANAQYHVRSGMVKTYTINAQGDEYVTGFYLPGDIVGVVHSDNCHAESALALETASVCELNDEALVQLAEIGLTTALVKRLAVSANTAMRQQINLQHTSAQGRFAGFCMMFSARLSRLGRCPTHLPTPMSRTDIANYLGMTLESLSRVISKLQATKVVRAKRDHIEILKPETLKTLGLHVDY